MQLLLDVTHCPDCFVNINSFNPGHQGQERILKFLLGRMASKTHLTSCCLEVTCTEKWINYLSLTVFSLKEGTVWLSIPMATSSEL